MLDARRMLDWSDAKWETWWADLSDRETAWLDENREASFRSILGLLTHMANIEAAWMDVAEEQEVDWARHSTKEWHELAPVRSYYANVRARTRKLVEGWSAEDLERRVPVGDHFADDTMSLEQLLFTVITHECYHVGEMLALYWQEDVEPPVVDYPATCTPIHGSAD